MLGQKICSGNSNQVLRVLCSPDRIRFWNWSLTGSNRFWTGLMTGKICTPIKPPNVKHGLHDSLWKECDETNIIVFNASQCWAQFWPFSHFWPYNLVKKRAKTAKLLPIFGFLEPWLQFWWTAVQIMEPVLIFEPLDQSELNRLQSLKMGLPGKLILSTRKGLREIIFSWK